MHDANTLSNREYQKRKKNQMEILELKSITEMKNSL